MTDSNTLQCIRIKAGAVSLLCCCLQVCAKCQVQGHTKAVTALLPLSNPRPGGGDMLISASLDGNLLVWDPSIMLPKGPEKEITSKLTIKAHADGVLSMALFQAAIETPDAQPLHLCTTGCLPIALHARLTYMAACWLHSWCTAYALQDRRHPSAGTSSQPDTHQKATIWRMAHLWQLILLQLCRR